MINPVTSTAGHTLADVPAPSHFLRNKREGVLADKVWQTFRDAPHAFELQQSNGQWHASTGHSVLQCHPMQMLAIGAVRMRTGPGYVYPMHTSPIRFAPEFLANVDELRAFAKAEHYTPAELSNVAHFFQAAQNNAAYTAPVAKTLLIAWELLVSPLRATVGGVRHGANVIDAWSDARAYNVRQYEDADLPGHQWGSLAKDVLCAD